MTATLRAAFAAAAKAAVAGPSLNREALGPDWLPNGYYTLALPCGTHRTLRLYTQQHGKLAGRRILGLLIGPDNTADYEDFAFVTPAGVTVWKRFQNQRQAAYGQLLWDLAGGEAIDGHAMAVSKRCLVCNRPLTTPESMARGIGPVCEQRLRK